MKFIDTCLTIKDGSKSKNKILIHCSAGISRSATIVIAYLMHSLQMKYEDAYRFLKGKRSRIEPNCGFVKQLLEYEIEISK